MSETSDVMELKEDDIRAHYAAAAEMLMGIDHSPRLAQQRLSLIAPEKSPEIASMSRRFRSTTPGLVTRTVGRPDGVRLIDRIAETDEDDPLTSPGSGRRHPCLAPRSGDCAGDWRHVFGANRSWPN